MSRKQKSLPQKFSPKAENRKTFKKQENGNAKLLLLLIIITAISFINAIQNNFLTWDDPDYVTQNPYITLLNPEGIATMFRVFVSCHYHPFTLISLAFDYAIWGTNPSGYIFTNILLHILNTTALFFLILKITSNRTWAFITVLLFAIHPMRSESVIWVSERKDVLYAFFYFISLYLYVQYINSGNKIKYYSAALLLFVFSLFAKATAVSLPLVLLLLDWYMGRTNYKRIIIEKIPFFILSLIFGLLAIKAQSVAGDNNKPFFEHIFLFSYATTFYIFKFFFPFQQSAVIPFPESINGFLPFKYYISILIFPLLGFAIYYFKKIQKELIFATVFFFLTLILVLIKFPIGPAYLAERYTYLPHIGLAFLTGFLYIKFKEKHKLKDNFKNIFFVVLILFATFFFIKTIVRNTAWKNSYTLFSDVVDKDPEYAFGLNNMAFALAAENKHAEAVNIYARAIEAKPDFADAYNNRATSLFVLKRYEEVIQDLNTSLKLSPDNPKSVEIYNNRGLAYFNLNNFNEAINDFTKAISLNPKHIEAYRSRMQCYSRLRSFENALKDLDQLMQLEPNNPENFNQKGILLAENGNSTNAAEAFTQALSLKSDPSFYINRGFVYLNYNVPEACKDFEMARQLNHKDALNLLNQYCRP